MMQGELDAASLRQMLFDTLDQSDGVVLVLEQRNDTEDGFVIVAVNDAFLRVSGYGNTDLVGQPFNALAGTDADSASYGHVMQAARERRSFRGEILCARQDGGAFWLGMHLMPAPAASPPRFVLLGRDITDSRHARQQQAAVQGLLAKVFLCVQAPVAIVTENGTMQMTNPALDRLMGCAPGQLVGRRAIDYLTPETQPLVIQARQRQIETGQDYTVPAAVMRADGTKIPVQLSSTTVERTDLKRFRIVTINQREDTAVSVHVAGKIKLVGLNEVKAELGPRWEEQAARVMASAEHVIRRRLGANDTCSRTPEGDFLICFTNCTEEEAAFRAAVISQEIRKRLLGEGETGGMAEVAAIAAAVELPDDPSRPPEALNALLGRRLDARLAEIEAKARATLHAVLETLSCDLEPIRDRQKPFAQYAQLPPELERRIHTAFCSLPVRERQAFDFDRLVLGVAAEQAVSDIAAGRTLPLMLNVDFDLFLDRGRMQRYFQTCHDLDARLRERLIMVLSGVPRNCPQSRLQDYVMRLRPFCTGLGLQLDSIDGPLPDMSVFDTPVVVLRAEMIDLRNAKEMGKLGRLIMNFHTHRGRVLVRRVRGWDDAKQLVRSGVNLVSVLTE